MKFFLINPDLVTVHVSCPDTRVMRGKKDHYQYLFYW